MKILFGIVLSLNLFAAPKVKMVTAGGYHTCALLEDGLVKCWGYNEYGQLGLGDQVDRVTPEDFIVLGQKAKMISAGEWHTCALLEDGSLKCWGYNSNGELGLGDQKDRLKPGEPINLGQKAKMVTAADRNTCVLLEDGSVKCWGNNNFGQLGLGDQVKRLKPVEPINLGQKAKMLSSGDSHVCALLEDGSVKCWGENNSGQLGFGDLKNRSKPEGAVELGQKSVMIASGSGHTCALLINGSIKCWGANYTAQLGSGDQVNRLKPEVSIDLGQGSKAVETGSGHTCASLEDGSVKCWGWNENGQLGQGTVQLKKDLSTLMPINIEPQLNIISISSGSFHVCAILEFGLLKCWGYNTYGQLGLGDTQNRGDGPNEMGKNLDFVEL